MGAIGGTAATNLLNASLGVSSLSPAFSGSAKVALTSTAPTETNPGTELSTGSYARQSVTFTAATGTSGSTTGPTSTTTWTASGASWSIVGLNIWDSGGNWWWYGTWVGQPISVASGNSFTLPSAGLTVSIA